MTISKVLSIFKSNSWKGVCIIMQAFALLMINSCGGSSGDETKDPVSINSCIAPERPAAESGFFAEEITFAQGSFFLPTMLIQNSAHETRWYLLTQTGQIFYVDSENPSTRVKFLDFRDSVLDPAANKNGRLLGLAFHPDYPSVPEVFVYYTGVENGVFSSVVKRVVLDNTDTPISPTIETVFHFRQRNDQHQGGDIQFGPDGYLYMAFGDGLNPVYAQQTDTFFGKMLRIDIEGTSAGYKIPPSNPFANFPACFGGINTGQPCAEVYAYGFRNPYRWGFDGLGQLWLGDVGLLTAEEINLVESGGNYGWPCFEGTSEYKTEFCSPDAELQFPEYEYSHADGDGAVVGGFVYSGAISQLQGKYIFADFVSGRIWSLSYSIQGEPIATLLIDTPYQITDVAPGNDNEIHFVDRATGSSFKLAAAHPEPTNTIPVNLEETGCLDAAGTTDFSASLIPYEINAPFWSDGAIKERYISIPDGTVIAIDGNDDWQFPNGTVLLKNFRLGNRLIETRLFMRHPDGIWAGYTWEWNEQQSHARRVIGGKTVEIEGQLWTFPSEAQCMVCHNSAAGFTLGPETGQLNRDIVQGHPTNLINQLDWLDGKGLYSTPLPDISVLPVIADYRDVTLPLEQRARSWLHSNCAHCHRANGTTPSSMDLRYTVPLAATNTCGIVPSSESFGIPNAKLIEPGNPDNSVLLERISRRDKFGMPPLASSEVDEYGLEIVRSWIAELSSCS